MTTDMNQPLLFTPITIRGVTAKNRIVVSPMCQYNSDDGGPGDWQMMHLGRLAVGGAGIIFGEETAIEARGRKTYSCAGIWDDKHIPMYRRITDFIKQQDSVPAIQLGHAGRKASCHNATEDWRPLVDDDAKDGFAPWQGLAPSALDQLPRRFVPRAMDRDDIRTVLDAWREATRRCVDAGYDILEIHGAHGYLIHQFLSPVSNQRNDAYGGDREGRMRFALEIAEVVREAWPQDKPLFFRVSAVDGQGGIWNLDDTVALAKELKTRGIDAVDCSSGGISGDSDMPMVPRIEQFQAGFSDRVRREADIMSIAVGGITQAQQADDILTSGRADLVAMAREFLWNADWAAHAAMTLSANDPFGQMPHEYAYRLRLREKQKDMPINQGGSETQAAYEKVFGTQ
ncbi:MAG: 2,4-dienoyl-CoA reductase-like NADH-dependent reductase (Old Yellow Enzyme family) [Gammaproteobacteria bacterium]|jgi:2,4-dienoyl-CoA reductase-like NADH-dependent reductase (Old Yellow Enzyme family)